MAAITKRVALSGAWTELSALANVRVTISGAERIKVAQADAPGDLSGDVGHVMGPKVLPMIQFTGSTKKIYGKSASGLSAAVDVTESA